MCALCDDAPSQQYLYPEFMLYQNLFGRSGIEALICDPRAHALYADERNLTLLCDESFLRSTGIPASARKVLLASVPRTEIVSAENRDSMWARRRSLFFKPAGGHGSKAAYRASLSRATTNFRTLGGGFAPMFTKE